MMPELNKMRLGELVSYLLATIKAAEKREEADDVLDALNDILEVVNQARQKARNVPRDLGVPEK